MQNKLYEYSRDSLPIDMVQSVENFEQKYLIQFENLFLFNKEYLEELTKPEIEDEHFNKIITIASKSDDSIIPHVKNLNRLVNSTSLKIEDQHNYFDSLKNIYRKLINKPDSFVKDIQSLFIAPEREGRILAEALNWLPNGRCYKPNIKRIHFNDGLIVGIDDLNINKIYKKCHIIDGAIASGSTIISVIKRIHKYIEEFHIYSVHSSLEGVSSLIKFANVNGIKIKINLGHITQGINRNYYAINPQNTNQTLVGDLGDMISGIEY